MVSQCQDAAGVAAEKTAVGTPRRSGGDFAKRKSVEAFVEVFVWRSDYLFIKVLFFAF